MFFFCTTSISFFPNHLIYKIFFTKHQVTKFAQVGGFVVVYGDENHAIVFEQGAGQIQWFQNNLM